LRHIAEGCQLLIVAMRTWNLTQFIQCLNPSSVLTVVIIISELRITEVIFLDKWWPIVQKAKDPLEDPLNVGERRNRPLRPNTCLEEEEELRII
jgi:hypothetical protein